MPNQTLSVQICDELVAALTPIVGERATVQRIWHPRAIADKFMGKTFVWVRPAAKPVQGIRRNNVRIEIAVTARLPSKSASTDDPYNNLDFIDDLDFLSEELARLFLQVDEDELAEGDTAGSLANEVYGNSVPAGVEMPVVISPEYMQQYRQFLSVALVTFQPSD